MSEPISMPAVLISPPQPEAFGALSKRYPVECLPLLGRAYIFRIVELLVTLGISEIVLYAGTFAAQFEEVLGNGQRWGVSLTVVDVPSVRDALQRLQTHHTPCLIGSALQLPALTADVVEIIMSRQNVRFTTNGTALNWGSVREWQANDADTLEDLFGADSFEEIALQEPSLDIDSVAHLLRASRAILSGQRSDLLIDGTHSGPGILIGHNVVLHPTAIIHPPVFLASDITIGKGVSLGPMAVVETDSIIDDFSTVESSIIMPGTYVGSELALKQSVVDRNYLIYSDIPGVVPVGDSFLIGPSETDNPITIVSLATRFFTLLVAISVLPLFLLLYLLGTLMAGGSVIRATRAVRLPAPEDPMLWRTFKHYEFSSDGHWFWRWLMGLWPLRGIPTLFNIVFGHVQWVGVRPRSPEELDSLPDDWQQLVLTGRVGLICLSDLDTDATHDDSLDQRYSSETFYIATRNLKNDIGVFFRALGHWRHQPH